MKSFYFSLNNLLKDLILMILTLNKMSLLLF